jgi:hypothetical protein
MAPKQVGVGRPTKDLLGFLSAHQFLRKPQNRLSNDASHSGSDAGFSSTLDKSPTGARVFSKRLRLSPKTERLGRNTSFGLRPYETVNENTQKQNTGHAKAGAPRAVQNDRPTPTLVRNVG